MKKLSFNSTLNHKRDGYNTYYVSVEKVVTLYGNEFLRLKNDTLDDNYWIARYHNLMRIDINDIAHCVLTAKAATEYLSIPRAQNTPESRSSFPMQEH